MLSSKTNTFLKSKIVNYIDGCCGYVKQEKQYLRILKKYNCNDYMNIDKSYLHTVLCCKERRFNIEHCINIWSDVNHLYLTNCIRQFCTKSSLKDDNVFGNLSYEKFESVEMDEDENEVERSTRQPIKFTRFKRLSYLEYLRLIKFYMRKKNLNLALSVLDLMKENGDKPNLFIYRLLLSAFAVQGDINQSFKLFKKLRDRGFILTPHVYTSLIDACAESKDTNVALERLDFLRKYFNKNKINLNFIHYNALVKAYGRHNQILTAFEIADEARDNGVYRDDMTLYLFHAAIGNKEYGLKYALALWHRMKKNKVKLNISHYNLLLRAIRDTNFGNLKVNNVLSFDFPETEIQLQDVTRPNLLNSPPVLSTSLLTMIRKPNIHQSNDNSSELDVVNNVELLSQNLDEILKKNRLFLFGGVNNFLNQMKNDGVMPDEKTVTLLIELLPPTMEIENYFLNYVKKNNLKTSITFFNMLIKKRCMRRCYDDAKLVLNEIQRNHFTPNIITFGALAIGCTKYKYGVELLEQMDAIGYVPNYTILETLVFNACYHKTFSYVLYLMYYLLKNQIKPSVRILNRLEWFDEEVFKIIQNQDQNNSKKTSFTKADYNKFKIKYENWKEKMKDKFHL